MHKKRSGENSRNTFREDIKNLSEHELRELILVQMYKMSLMRAQLEAMSNILIKNKLATYEEIWKETNKHFEDTY